MSRVTGVMLICELSGFDDRPSDSVQQTLDWLAERESRPGEWRLKEIADHAGGFKHPQFEAWCGGFNFFEGQEDEFAAFVLSREWDMPELTVLVLQSEEADPRVFRVAAEC
jgi:hypothetical protein